MRYLIIVIITFFFNSFFLEAEDTDSIASRINLNTNKFKYMLETIYLNYSDTVDIDGISETAFKVMFNSLDKNSGYFTRDQLYKKQVSSRAGLRHRASIGITERSDAIAIIVSEETGRISYSIKGDIEFYITPATLQQKITTDLGLENQHK